MEPTSAVSVTAELQNVLSQMTGTINVASIAEIIAIGVGACVGFVLLYFGVRKLLSMVQRALKGRGIR